MSTGSLQRLLRLIAHGDVFRLLELSESDILTLRLVCSDVEAAIFSYTLFWRALIPGCQSATDVLEICKMRSAHKRAKRLRSDAEVIVRQHMSFAPVVKSLTKEIGETEARLLNLRNTKRRYEEAQRASPQECREMESIMQSMDDSLRRLYSHHGASAVRQFSLDSPLPESRWKKHKP